MRFNLFLITSLLFLFACTDHDNELSTDSPSELITDIHQPQNIISMNEAMAKIQAFENATKDEKEARSGFIDLQNLKDYIAFSESNMSELNKEMSGVEIFFGRYLDHEEGHHFKDQVGLIFFPTYKDGKGIDIPFDFSNQQTIKDAYADYLNGGNLNRNASSSAMNRSNMSPPRIPND